MPVFEYKCKECGNIKEVFNFGSWQDCQRASSFKKVKCPKCKIDMEKIISKSNFHLKGNGWFKDGYK
jgi:putative FmdB family regulatory protein